MSFSINYNKVFNKKLKDSLESNDDISINNFQNYYPLMDNFFNLNEKNYNLINLNNKYQLNTINSKLTNNIFDSSLIDSSGNIINKEVFFKYSPLIDPTKYLVGKFENNDNIFNLPHKEKSEDFFSKYKDTNNLSYVDSFFSYLTSQLLNNHKFIHGLDFYGSYLCIKNEFNVNVEDEIDILEDSDFFNKNLDILFKISNEYYELIDNDNTRNYKKNIKIGQSLNNIEIDNIDNISNLIESTNLFPSDLEENPSINPLHDNENDENLIYENINHNKSNNTNSSGSISSRSSNDENSDEDDENSDEDDEDENDEDDENSDEDDENSDENHEDDENSDEDDEVEEDEKNIVVSINKFPIKLIVLEKCSNTLDYLLEKSLIDSKELGAILMQIIMILIVYQKTFSFTHNDLHTNNIMYVETEVQYLYYCVEKIHYKVPTYGKIFKIIDFGRAIYKFNKKLLCSDSFSCSGDAHTQYNCEPYYDPKKKKIEPNFSFDLCRLACSIFDFIIDDIDNVKDETNEVFNIIVDWCNDDKNRNILYKKNGEERYLEFKLYKMIARTVHNHLPLKQLERPFFNNFRVSKKKINNSKKIINIDNIPIYTN